MTKIYINTATKNWTAKNEKAKKWQAEGARIVWCYKYELNKVLAKI